MSQDGSLFSQCTSTHICIFDMCENAQVCEDADKVAVPRICQLLQKDEERSGQRRCNRFHDACFDCVLGSSEDRARVVHHLVKILETIRSERELWNSMRAIDKFGD